MEKTPGHTSLIIFVLLMMSMNLYAQSFSNGFPFYLPPTDTFSPPTMPAFPARTIAADEFVGIDAHGHFTVKGNCIRFFGTNCVGDGAFPDKSESFFIAGRLRKMGFNLIRFHHLDNPWSAGSLFEQARDTRHLNLIVLDRMEKFISELKKNNIYANINLLVSRTFNSLDGVPDADSIRNYGKGVTLFDRQLIDLQKEYASQLLTHANPYTGLALVNDPVMAMLEIINENSLYMMWRTNRLKPFARGGDLTGRHNRMLDSLWNEFLTTKYQTTANLENAWNQGTSGSGANDQIVDGGFETLPITQNWQLEKHGTANATMSTETIQPAYQGTKSAKIDVTAVDGTEWHIQWKHIHISVKQDSFYTVTFAGRASGNRTIYVAVMKETDPWTTYSGQSFILTTQWQFCEFTFKASETRTNDVRLSFNLGGATGSYWFDDIHFTAAIIKGLEEDENLEQHTVKRTDYSACTGYSNQRVADMSAFYMQIQNGYFQEMHEYLKNNLQVKVPVVGTNWNSGTGDLASQSGLDYVDNHSYWDHPSFPNEPWSSTDWYIHNQPMVSNTDNGTIPWLMGGVPFKDKPVTISEYNHAFPNRYQTEGVLFLTAYAAFHDADALMFFDYNGSTDWETDKVSGYFDIDRNTAMMALMPSCAYAFRQQFITPSLQPVILNFSQEDILLLPKNDSGWWQGPDLFPRKIALQHGVRNGSFDSSIPFDPASLPSVPVNPYTTDTGEITWNTDGLLQVVTDEFVGLTGFLNNFPNTICGPLQIIDASDFTTLTWSSVSSLPLQTSTYSLLTISSRMQNTGMVWDGITTIHDNWGHAPTLMYPVNLTLRLNIEADSIRVYPLNEWGQSMDLYQTYFPVGANRFEVILDQELDQTLWYSVERYGTGTAIEDLDQSLLPDHFKLEQNYPNPFNPVTTIRYQLPVSTHVRLVIYNALGKVVTTLVEKIQPAGYYQLQWKATVASGIYFCRLQVKDFTSVKKMMVLQ